MNSLERFRAVLGQQPVDRPPVMGIASVVTVELMKRVGTAWPDAHHDPEQMVRAGASAHEVCGLESVKVPFDMTAEAGALGAEIDYGSGSALPKIRQPLLAAPEDLQAPTDLVRRGRVPVVLEAIRIAKRRYGSEVPVISSVVGPITLSGCLFGLETLLVWMIEEPEKVHAAMRAATSLVTVYIRAQLDAGTHVVQVGDPTASGDLISPAQFGEFVAPYHKEITAAVDAPLIVHICGNITRQLPALGGSGFAGVSFDAKTDIQAARTYLKGKAALIGYVPTTLLLGGSPDEVRRAARECLAEGVDILNAGCAMAPDTPIENIQAMISAVTR